MTAKAPGSTGSGWSHSTIPIRALASGRLEWEGELPAVGGLWSGTDLRFREDPAMSLTVERSVDGGVHVVGSLDAAYRLTCRRCLQDMVHEVRLPIDVWFEPAVGEDPGDEAVYGLGSDATAIDLAPAMRDELILARPGFPVCRSECAGMCPGCGSNLNDEACTCGPKDIDPRWEALRGLEDSGSTERK